MQGIHILNGIWPELVPLIYVIMFCYKPDSPEKDITASLISTKSQVSFLTRTILLLVYFIQDLFDLQELF